MKPKHPACAAMAIVLGLLLACSRQGEALLGKWTSGRYTIEIVKRGEAILVVEGRDTYPARLNDDGTLTVAIPFGQMIIAYSKESDTIYALGDEFKRVQ